jgi:spore germination cell wall hydrolase CwlJ-like protein
MMMMMNRLQKIALAKLFFCWVLWSCGIIWIIYYQKAIEQVEPILDTDIVTTADDLAAEDYKDQMICLAMNIYFEARNDSLAGKFAVADVVLNRVDTERYPTTICAVVRQTKTTVNWKGKIVPKLSKCQFSWFCDGKSDVPKDQAAWKVSYRVAAEILEDGRFRGITEGATHYHALYVEPDWVDDRGMKLIGVIGLHRYHKWH